MPNRRHSPHSTSSIGLGLAIAAAIALLLWSCSSESEPTRSAAPATASTTTAQAEAAPTTTTTTTPPTPEQTVKAAYLGAAVELDAAFAASDPTWPGLKTTRIDPNLSLVRKTLSSRQEAGLVLSYPAGQPPQQHITGLKIGRADTATLTVCVIDDAVMVDAISGKSTDDSIVSRLNKVQMRQVKGKWMVSDVSEPAVFPGKNGCKE